MISSYLGIRINLQSMRRRFPPGARGLGLRRLIEISTCLGLNARAVRLSLENLENLHTPAMLHWDMRHFVVLERVKKKRALIHDPDGRTAWMSLSDVSSHFTGVALEFRPSVSLESVGDLPVLRIRNLWGRIVGLKRALLQTIMLSLILQVFLLAAPYYMQLAVDTALPALDKDLLDTLAIGFGIFTIINAVAALFRGFVLLSAGSSLAFGIATNVVQRLFRLPVAWFESRHTGDILSRLESIAPLQEVLTEGAVSSVIDGILAATTLAVMYFYNALMASIAVIALAIVISSRIFCFSVLREAVASSLIAHGKEQSTLIESIRGMVTVRLAGCESLRHALWQSRRVDTINADIGKARVGIWLGFTNVLVFGIETVLSTWVGVRLVMQGAGFSVGMIFAFMAYKLHFIQKSEDFVDRVVKFRMLSLHLERLSDIGLAKEDRSFGVNEEKEEVLKGEVELRNISFRYTEADPFVLSDVNLLVKPGEHIAITGLSGTGKSTLVQILLGLAEPNSGDVFVDGIPLSRFGYKSYQRQISGVLQNDSLFAGSLAENIALFDDQVDMAVD